MAPDFLHNHPNYVDLIKLLSVEKNIHPVLIEKDYWIMHCLFGLRKQGLNFQLKGGTSLSKGFNLIHRFSEDIDIHIEPPHSIEVPTGKNHEKEKHIKARANYYDWLSNHISVDGILTVERDHYFDNQKMWSGGIRLYYPTTLESVEGTKEGVLLEAGFDNVAPNKPRTISSWAYDFASTKLNIIDNRAINTLCYLPQYTFVEKLQTISTKYRKFLMKQEMPMNFLRHYYDVYCLLNNKEVQNFIGTPEYMDYKEIRFPNGDELNIARNEAFLLNNIASKAFLNQKYQATKNLYYQGQIPFEDIISKIKEYIDIL